MFYSSGKVSGSGLDGADFAGFLTQSPTSAVDGFNFINPGNISGLPGIGAFFREQVPWRDIADWTHKFPSTPTDKWMDVIGGAVRGPNHRWQNHHPVDFFSEWLKQGSSGNLKVGDYLKHASLDFITAKGLPLLPQNIHTMLLDLGISKNALFAWTHVNVFDVAIGGVSVGTGAFDLFLSISGEMPWGKETILISLGGALELGVGFYSANPFLVAGGAMKISAGLVSYWQHIHLPDPTILEGVIDSLFVGFGSGVLGSIVRLSLNWNETTLSEKAIMSSESMALSTSTVALASISSWLAIPLSASYGVGKFAHNLAKKDNIFWDQYKLSSSLSSEYSIQEIESKLGKEGVDDLLSFFINEDLFNYDQELKTWLNDYSGIEKWFDGDSQVLDHLNMR